MRRSLRTGIAVLTSCCMVAALNGCSAPQPSISVDQAVLDDVVAAIPLYEFSSSRRDRSQIALVKTDGSYALITNSAMFYNVPIWTDRWLFFPDSNNDYYIGVDPTDTKVVSNEKTDFSYNAIAIDDDHILTVYNSGLQDMDIGDNQVVVSSPNGTIKQAVFSTADGGGGGDLALCGTDVYNISSTTTFTSPDGIETHSRAIMGQVSQGTYPTIGPFVRLNADPSGFTEEEVSIVGDTVSVYSLEPGLGLPCRNDVVVFIGLAAKRTDTQLTSILTVVSWNVKTGDYSLTTLKDSNGTLITQSYGDEWGDFRYTDNGLLGDELIFLNGESGRILRVNIKTGISRELAMPDYPGGWPYNGRFHLEVMNGRIYLSLLPMNDSAGTESFINVYDADDGSLIKQMKIDDRFTEYLQKDTVQSGRLAYNPKEPLF